VAKAAGDGAGVAVAAVAEAAMAMGMGMRRVGQQMAASLLGRPATTGPMMASLVLPLVHPPMHAAMTIAITLKTGPRLLKHPGPSARWARPDAATMMSSRNLARGQPPRRVKISAHTLNLSPWPILPSEIQKM